MSIDFNEIVRWFTETSEKFELVVIKDGKSYSEHKDGKLIVHI